MNFAYATTLDFIKEKLKHGMPVSCNLCSVICVGCAQHICSRNNCQFHDNRYFYCAILKSVVKSDVTKRCTDYNFNKIMLEEL